MEKKHTPTQDIIEFICGAGTYDSLWWDDKPMDRRPTFWWRSKLRDHNADLLAKVSEQEKEINRLQKESNWNLEQCIQLQKELEEFKLSHSELEHRLKGKNHLLWCESCDSYKKELKDTTKIYEKERAYLRELANKKIDEAERYAKLIHSKNDESRKQDIVASEQSQRIEALTKENEQMKAEVQEYHNEIVRLREERKELIDILTRIIPLAEDGHALHKRNGVHQEFLSEDVERISIAKSLLSKFEVPNQS